MCFRQLSTRSGRINISGGRWGGGGSRHAPLSQVRIAGASALIRINLFLCVRRHRISCLKRCLLDSERSLECNVTIERGVHHRVRYSGSITAQFEIATQSELSLFRQD